MDGNEQDASICQIFRVVPTQFSPETISNSLALAHLTEKDKKIPVESGVLAGKGVVSFESRDGTRHLDVIPSQGVIALNRKDVIAKPRESVVGVPMSDDAIRSTVSLLPKLGIRPSEIVTNAQGKPVPYSQFEQKDFHKEKATGKIVTNIISHGVSLNRQIDGVPVGGALACSRNSETTAKLPTSILRAARFSRAANARCRPPLILWQQ